MLTIYLIKSSKNCNIVKYSYNLKEVFCIILHFKM